MRILQPYGVSANLTTSLTTPLILGGTAASSTLTLQGTSGTGTTDLVQILHGTNGALAGFVSKNVSGVPMVGIGTTPTTQRLEIASGGLRFNHTAGPGACVGALAGLGAGNLTNGTYTYRVSYVTAAGESALGTTSNTVTITDATTNGQIALTSIPVSSTTSVTARKIYRTIANQIPLEYQLVATISDNTTTTYTDNIADASLTTYIKFTGDTAGSLWSGTTKGVSFENDSRSVVFNPALNGDFLNSPLIGRNSPASKRNAVNFACNGYLYVIGGDDGTTAATVVYYSKIAPNGRLGAWTTEATNTLTAARTHAAYVFVNGYIYVIAGSSAAALANGQTTVYYAKPQPDGSMGTWATTTALPTALSQAKAVYHNGYIYVSGGLTTASATVSTIYYAKVNADGTLGAWITSVNTMPVALAYHGFSVANGYLYITGGRTGSANTTAVTPVYYSLIGATGAPGAFSTSGQALPVAISDHSVNVDNGFLYACGGVNASGAGVAVMYYAPFGGATGISAGEIGAWSSSTNNTGNSGAQKITQWLDYWFFNIPTSAVIRWTYGPRVVFGNNLNLLPGAQDQGMAGGAGGKLFAGDIHSAGKLDVMGSAYVRGDMRVLNTFGVSPSAADSVATGTGNAAGISVAMTGAAGGANSSTGSVAAGIGGSLALTGGVGGAETGASGANTGGVGGLIELLGGTGGAATSGTGGVGGKVYITGGAAGSGGSPVASAVALCFTSAGTAQGKLGIFTASPTNDVSLGSTANRTLAVERHASTTGASLTIQSGGGFLTGTDKAAGNLILATGVGTGNATPGVVKLQTSAIAAATGSSDNAIVDRAIFGGTKVLTNASPTTLLSFTIANGSTAGGVVHYLIEVTDATDYQNEVGSVYFNAVNKAGTVTRTIAEVSSQQALSSGATLATTWAISAANPSVLSINANSSLTPSTGYPRVTYNVQYFGSQVYS